MVTGQRPEQDKKVGAAAQPLPREESPHALRVGGITVNTAYAPDGKPLGEALKSYLTAIRNQA